MIDNTQRKHKPTLLIYLAEYRIIHNNIPLPSSIYIHPKIINVSSKQTGNN